MSSAKVTQNTKEVEPIDFQEIEGLDTLSEEERDGVYKEIELIFKNQSENKDTLRFDISGASRGVRFPIIFNIVLIAVVGAGILTTSLLLNNRDKELISSNTIVKESGKTLAQEIISQNKEALKQQEDELANLQKELQGILSGSVDIDTIYENKITNYKKQLDTELNDKQTALRKQLESQNINEAEIKRRLAEQEKKLRSEYEARLAKYKQEQEAEKAKQKADIEIQKAALEAQINDKETQRKTLEAEISKREQELQKQLAQQTQAINNQLNQAQSSLAALQQSKEARDKAFNEFNIYHQRIISLVNRNQFTDAKIAISDALLKIDSSPYKTDPGTATYLDSFNTYSNMIDAYIKNQQTYIKNQQTASNAIRESETKTIQELRDTITTLEANIVTLNNTIEKSQVEQANTQKEISNLKSQIASSKNSAPAPASDAIKNELKKLQADYLTLQKSYENLQKSNNNQAVIEGLGLRRNEVNNILANIRLIANYLAIKSAGTEDNDTREQIIQLTKQFELYNNIIEILSAAIDPSGNLRL